MPKEYSFDSECFELAQHFFGDAPVELLNELAQRIQDQVESSPELDAWIEARLREHETTVAAEGDDLPF
jgi:hypothetical protein